MCFLLKLNPLNGAAAGPKRHNQLIMSTKQADINAPRIGGARTSGGMPRPATRQRRRRAVRKARAVIRREYVDPDLSLADVAEKTGISPRQLQRIFREEDGEDIRGYLLRVRMEKAAQLLGRKRNPLPIRLTARRVGYRHASGLRQALVRFYGYNPSAIQPEPPHYIGDVEFRQGP